ncbi:MAG: hypothetical protein IT373_14595 [Polyangiaceae bacterium]|nr:hypothetical protein [Polyangiaceae bacterium]
MSRLFEDEDLLSALDNRADDATTRKMLEDPSFVDALNRARDFLETGEDPLFLRVRGTSLRIASGLVEAARIKGQEPGASRGEPRSRDEPRSHGVTERDTERPLNAPDSVQLSVPPRLRGVAPVERARIADETVPHGVAVGARQLGATHVNGIVLGAGVVLACFVVAMILLAILHRSSPAAEASASTASGAPAPSASRGTASDALAVTSAVPSAATSTPRPSPSTTGSAEPAESASAPLLPATRPPPLLPPASTSAAPPPPSATSPAPATTTTSSIRIID